jgi:hypothetical protein
VSLSAKHKTQPDLHSTLGKHRTAAAIGSCGENASNLQKNVAKQAANVRILAISTVIISYGYLCLEKHGLLGIFSAIAAQIRSSHRPLVSDAPKTCLCRAVLHWP